MTEKLIECVRKHPSLYDTKNSSYKNVASKARIWEQIGKEINETGDVAKKKWKSLRDNYLRYKKEIAGTTGQAAKKFAKWPWIAQLQFLDTTLAERERASNVSRNTDSSDTPPPESPHSDIPFQESPLGTPPPGTTSSIIPPPVMQQVLSEQGSTSIPNEPTPARPYTKKSKKDFTEMDQVINYLHNKKRKEYDAVDHLFQSYAETFKSFSKSNQIKLKVELAKLFADIEAQELQERDTSIVLHSPTYTVISSECNDSRNYEDISFSRPESGTAPRMSQPVADLPPYSALSQPTLQSSNKSLSHTLQLSNRVNFPHATVVPMTSAQDNDIYVNEFSIFRKK